MTHKDINDVVSREAVMKIVDEEWICNADYDFRSLVEALEKLPSVTQKPNFCASCKHNTDNEICLECEYDGITRGMTRYESVIQKSGKWLKHSYARKCSECGSVTCWTDDEGTPIPDKYCPNCGAKMENAE